MRVLVVVTLIFGAVEGLRCYHNCGSFKVTGAVKNVLDMDFTKSSLQAWYHACNESSIEDDCLYCGNATVNILYDFYLGKTCLKGVVKYCQPMESKYQLNCEDKFRIMGQKPHCNITSCADSDLCNTAVTEINDESMPRVCHSGTGPTMRVMVVVMVLLTVFTLA